jgi:hypothetical protein
MPSPLEDVLKRSGAHMAEREGWLVAADALRHLHAAARR